MYAYATTGFWVLDINNEAAFTNINPGPPHVSLPRAEPGSGIMGFTMLKDTDAGENFYRSHLVLNQTFSNPHGDEGVPFLAIGSDSRRGNSAAVGAINPTSGFMLWATSEWNGIPRMLFLYLFHWNIEQRTNGNPGADAKWNWPIDEHYLYPGADIALVDAEDVSDLCGFWVKRLKNIGEEFTYTVDLNAVFHCLANNGYFDDPIPSTSNIPITGVHWTNENSGTDGWLWTSVHGMQMID